MNNYNFINKLNFVININKSITNINKFFSPISDFNNLKIYTIENNKNINYISEKDYYQSYPIIQISNKLLLSSIYNIKNVNELKQWLENNKYKNYITINRVLDYAWIYYEKDIYTLDSFFKDYYINLLHTTFDIDKKKLEKYINKLFTEFSKLEKKDFFSNYIDIKKI